MERQELIRFMDLLSLLKAHPEGLSVNEMARMTGYDRKLIYWDLKKIKD